MSKSAKVLPTRDSGKVKEEIVVFSCLRIGNLWFSSSEVKPRRTAPI
jgi:hypothetical protein